MMQLLRHGVADCTSSTKVLVYRLVHNIDASSCGAIYKGFLCETSYEIFLILIVG